MVGLHHPLAVVAVVAMAVAAAGGAPVAAGLAPSSSADTTGTATDPVDPVERGTDRHEIGDCTTIDEPGEYVLTRNVSSDAPPNGACIVVAADDVTLDGQGHTIDGQGTGVGIAAGPDTTVRHLTVREFRDGIRFSVPDGETWSLHVTDSTITANDETGINVSTGVEVNATVLVNRTAITDNGLDGLRFVPVDDATGASTLDFDVHWSVIDGNDRYGIRPDDFRVPFIVDATYNYWGAVDGPSSSSDPTVSDAFDPFTGKAADGTGDRIEIGATELDVSAVHFDPYLGRSPLGDETGPIHYQIDLAVGSPLQHVGPAGEGSFYGDERRLVRNVHGDTENGFLRSGTGGPRSLAPEHAACLTYESVNVTETRASVTVTVAEGCQKRLTLAAYVKPGPGFDRSMDQDLYDSRTINVGPGTYTLTVSLPPDPQHAPRTASDLTAVDAAASGQQASAATMERGGATEA